MDIESKIRKKRKQNFTFEEEMILAGLIEAEKHIFTNKESNAVTWKEKENAWKKLAQVFAAKTGVHRNWKSLRDKFDNLKRKSRLELSAKKSSTCLTGGGTAAKITAILDDSDDGLDNAFDGDSCNVYEILLAQDNSLDSGRNLQQEVLIENIPESLTKSRPISRKPSLEDERIKLVLLQQDFYKGQNERAQEKHEQELIQLKLKNELLQMEIVEKKAKLEQAKCHVDCCVVAVSLK